MGGRWPARPAREPAVQDIGEPHSGGDHPLDGPVDLGPGGLVAVEVVAQVLGPDHPVGHLHVETGVTDRPASEAEDPVADHEALESPLVAEHVGEQVTVLAAPLAVDAVVGAHHHGDTFVDDALEVGEVHLVQRHLVDGDVHREAGVLHRVAGEVLDAGHGVALHAPGQGRPHLADVVGVLPVGLLGPAPCRMAEDVHADPAEEVGAHGPQLLTDGLADPLLQLDVPGGAPGHAHREAGGLVDDHPPGAVGEGESGESDPLHRGRPERALVVAGLGQIGQAGPEGRIPVQAPELLGRRSSRPRCPPPWLRSPRRSGGSSLSIRPFSQEGGMRTGSRPVISGSAGPAGRPPGPIGSDQ